MAQITKKHLFTLSREAWGIDAGKIVKVGNNRTLLLDPAGHLNFALHGNVIAQACDGEIWLDPCGWKSRTTQAAMRDFLKACGISGGVSFAGGNVSGKYRNGEGEIIAMEHSCGMLHFPIPEGSKLCGN